MRLRSELNAVLALAAAVALAVIGWAAWAAVRGVHHRELVAQGQATGLYLAKGCALAIRGPSPAQDLEALLALPTGDDDPPVVAAIVWDPTLTAVLAQVGATSREERGAEDDRLLRDAAAADAGTVLVTEGEAMGRYGPRGEDLTEFTLPIVDAGVRLGVLRLSLAQAPSSSVATTTLGVVALAGLVLGGLWVVLYQLAQRRILGPILSLSAGIARVRGGDLSARVDLPRKDEIGSLGDAFNDLIAVLVERDSLAARLEEANRLAEAHRELAEAHRQLKLAQEQLILTEKHASLGRLVHGLNHELNNPLSAAKNMVPPLEAAIATLRAALAAPASPQAPAPEGPDRPVADEKVLAVPGAAGGDAARTPPSGRMPPPVAPAPAGAPAPAALLDRAGLDEALDDAHEAVAVIRRSVGRAINIVRDLGQFSKLGAADLEEVALRELVGEAVLACAPELGPGERVTVALDIPEVDGAPLRLKAFPSLLLQVFVNLLTNSAQAIEGPGRVKVLARLVGDRVHVEVEDNGPGIPREHLSKVFEPFFTTKEPGRGSGLGLSICLGVVEKHGGTIVAQRRRRGACFVLDLPREPKLEPQDPRQSASLFSASTVTLTPSAVPAATV